MASVPSKITSSTKNFYRKHPLISHILLILFTGLLFVWLAMIFLAMWTDHGDIAKIPDVKSKTYDEAYQMLTSEGFHVEISDSIYDSGTAPGTVLESWPRSGAVVKPGREVYLTITSFQPRQVVVTMPITNMDSRQAMSYLEESLGITHVRLVSVPSQYPDLVIGAKYNGKEIKPGTKLPVNALVTLEVGTVPNVTEVDADADESNGEIHAAEAPLTKPACKPTAPKDDDASNSSIYD